MEESSCIHRPQLTRMPDTWAPLADRFFAYYDSVQGHVRTHLIDRNLRNHLPPAPAELVDVGGGAGHQALPLARDGYGITIVEPSEEMLRRASDLLAAEPAEVRERVTLVRAGRRRCLGRGRQALCRGDVPRGAPNTSTTRQQCSRLLQRWPGMAGLCPWSSRISRPSSCRPPWQGDGVKPCQHLIGSKTRAVLVSPPGLTRSRNWADGLHSEE